MRSIGVRELQNHTSQVLREVTSERKPVNITRNGRVVARIVPVEESLSEEELEQFEQTWTDMDQLAAEISARWPAGVSAVDAVSTERR